MITESLSRFEFANPHWLWLLLALPLLAWLRGRKGNAPAVTFSTAQPLAAIGRSRRAARGALGMGLPLLVATAWISALARPQFVTEQTVTQSSGVDIMLVLDVSRSMYAEDFTIGGQRANRLDAVKQVTEKFIAGRQTDRIGIVAFAGRPYLVSPLTLDHNWLALNLERIRIGLVEDGTAIGSAIAAAANRLKESEAESRLIVLLTDGDNNAGPISPETAAEAAAALGVKIYTIGAGSQGVAPYPVVDAFGRTQYRRVRMEFDEAALQRIADIGGGSYYRASNNEALQEVFEEIDRLEKSEVAAERYDEIRDLYRWPLLGGLGVFLVQLLLAHTILRKVP